jgi:transcriptional regulator with XRE-family HTH domain
MGFKENLKSELTYTGTLVKELSVQTGISKHTLDNYLNTHNSLPNAEAAVKIARALGVTVEYLVTGQKRQQERTLSSLPVELRLLVDNAEKLSPKNRKLAVKLVKAIGEQQEGD